MNLLMLSGNSLRNKQWIEEAKAELASQFDQVQVQDYAHWHTGSQWIDLNHELGVLKRTVAGQTGPYGVFAKSIGTVLAMQAAQKGFFQPGFALLMGIPLDYIISDYPQFKDVLTRLTCPVSIVHNTNDKVGTAQAVAEYLGKDLVDAVRWHTPEANNHDYEDYELLRAELDALTRTSQGS